jgi:hypothetical protein
VPDPFFCASTPFSVSNTVSSFSRNYMPNASASSFTSRASTPRHQQARHCRACSASSLSLSVRSFRLASSRHQTLPDGEPGEAMGPCLTGAGSEGDRQAGGCQQSHDLEVASTGRGTGGTSGVDQAIGMCDPRPWMGMGETRPVRPGRRLGPGHGRQARRLWPWGESEARSSTYEVANFLF